jgi:predicted HTH domain antitoxin
VVNKTITAFDRGHISKTYALELAAPFRTAFRKELFR